MLIVWFLVFLIQTTNCYRKTPLDEYVQSKIDLNYQSYRILSVITHETYKEYRLNITTQKWLNEKVSTQHIWKHDLYVYTPLSKPISNISLLYIDDGYNDGRTDNIDDKTKYLTKMVKECNCIVSLVRQIPNQPIKLYSDPLLSNRIEDEIISWTWKMYFDQKVNFKNATRETEYLPLLLPMTKAVVRTMNILEVFSFSVIKTKIKNFVLTGASKRGWTSWLTAAVDQRVIGIAPIVFDFLNQQEIFHHHYRSYGGAYSFAMGDYYDAGILDYIDTSEFLELMMIIDPYYYLERFGRVKVLLFSGTNDVFFPPEDTKFYWKKLMTYTNENCYIRWFPNAGHSLRAYADKLFSSIEHYLQTFTEPELYSLPKLRWHYNQNFTHMSVKLTLENLACSQVPVVSMYTARTLNSERRDFRNYVFDGTEVKAQNIEWKQVELINMNSFSTGPNSYKITYETENNIIDNEYWQGYLIQVGIYLNKKHVKTIKFSIYQQKFSSCLIFIPYKIVSKKNALDV